MTASFAPRPRVRASSRGSWRRSSLTWRPLASSPARVWWPTVDCWPGTGSSADPRCRLDAAALDPEHHNENARRPSSAIAPAVGREVLDDGVAGAEGGHAVVQLEG